MDLWIRIDILVSWTNAWMNEAGTALIQGWRDDNELNLSHLQNDQNIDIRD